MCTAVVLMCGLCCGECMQQSVCQSAREKDFFSPGWTGTTILQKRHFFSPGWTRTTILQKTHRVSESPDSSFGGLTTTKRTRFSDGLALGYKTRICPIYACYSMVKTAVFLSIYLYVCAVLVFSKIGAGQNK